MTEDSGTQKSHTMQDEPVGWKSSVAGVLFACSGVPIALAFAPTWHVAIVISGLFAAVGYRITLGWRHDV